MLGLRAILCLPDFGLGPGFIVLLSLTEAKEDAVDEDVVDEEAKEDVVDEDAKEDGADFLSNSEAT